MNQNSLSKNMNLSEFRRINCSSMYSAIGQIGNPAAVRLARIATTVGDKELRITALEALGYVEGGEVAATELCQWLGNEDKDLNYKAIESLQRLDNETAAFVVGRSLKHRDWHKRLAAIVTLGGINSNVARDFLLESRHDVNLTVRSAADYMLQKGRVESEFDLRSMLYDREYFRDGLKRFRSAMDTMSKGIAQEKWTAREEMPKQAFPSSEKIMSLADHLEELRYRLRFGLASMWLFFFGAMLLYSVAVAPATLQSYGISELNALYIWKLQLAICFGVGIVLMIPVLIFEIWQFSKPGLTPREQRVGFIVLTGIAFVLVTIGGISFLMSRFITDIFGAEFLDVSAKIFVTNGLSVAIAGTTVITLTWLFVRFSARFPGLYDYITVFIILLGSQLGSLARFYLGTERIQSLRYIMGKDLFAPLTGGLTKRRKIAIAVVVLTFLVVPIYTYIPILVSLGILLLSVPVSKVPEVVKSGATAVRTLLDYKVTLSDSSTAVHLAELRNRLVLVFVIPIVVATILCVAIYLQVLETLLGVYSLPSTVLGTLAPNFPLRLEIAVGIVLALLLPLSAYEFWLFIKPGLELTEQRYGKLATAFAMTIPFVFILTVSIYSRLLSGHLTDIEAWVSGVNKAAMVSILLLSSIVITYSLALLRLSRSIRLIAQGAIAILALTVLLWPIWVFSVLALSFTLLAVVGITKLLEKMRIPVR